MIPQFIEIVLDEMIRTGASFRTVAEELMYEHNEQIVNPSPAAEPRLTARHVSILEHQAIVDALKRNAGNFTKAAQDIGMPKSTFHDYVKKNLGLRKHQPRVVS